MSVRYTRDVSDWGLVIRALEIMGGVDDLSERIRDACRSPQGGFRRSVVAEGRDVDALDLAMRFADEGRPSHFPPVEREVLTDDTRPAGAQDGGGM